MSMANAIAAENSQKNRSAQAVANRPEPVSLLKNVEMSKISPISIPAARDASIARSCHARVSTGALLPLLWLSAQCLIARL
jgi:hypothetical protein